jgi:hypothetical protein
LNNLRPAGYSRVSPKVKRRCSRIKLLTMFSLM